MDAEAGKCGERRNQQNAADAYRADQRADTQRDRGKPENIGAHPDANAVRLPVINSFNRDMMQKPSV